MCDTMAARAAATVTGGTLFAKNSDRERNEAQFLQILPAQRYGRGAVVRTTYIAIPQVARTHAVLLSRPFWIWGAEMGANEHGVVIGNEAVHPRALPQRQRALIGMDLLRLGLERGATAAEAVDVITSLLEEHGQGGSCGHMAARFYDNSFIVADKDEIFVLETIGRRWAVQRAGDVRAISNTYTISVPDRASADLESFTRAEGWWNANKFDFAAAVTSHLNPGLPVAQARCAQAMRRLTADAGTIGPHQMMSYLRDHGATAAPSWHPQDVVGGTICMHAADGTRRGQSVGSMVSDLRATGALHWVTGTSAPCTSIFKPVFVADGLPDQGPIPGDAFDDETLWWRHETLHRAILVDYAAAMAEIAPERDALERSFAERMMPLIGAPGPARQAAVAQCWREAAAAEAGWLARIGGRAPLRPSYLSAWKRHDRLAGARLTCQPAALAVAAE